MTTVEQDTENVFGSEFKNMNRKWSEYHAQRKELYQQGQAVLDRVWETYVGKECILHKDFKPRYSIHSDDNTFRPGDRVTVLRLYPYSCAGWSEIIGNEFPFPESKNFLVYIQSKNGKHECTTMSYLLVLVEEKEML